MGYHEASKMVSASVNSGVAEAAQAGEAKLHLECASFRGGQRILPL